MSSNENSASNDAPEVASKKITKEKFSHFLHIFKYVLQYKGLFILGLLFLLLSTLTSLSFPYLATMLPDATNGNASLSINQIGLVLMGVLIAQAIFSYARVLLFAYVSEYTMADIRKEVYTKLISLDLAFFEKRRVGELTSRITNDVAQLQSAISVTLAEFLRQIATLLIGILIIAYTSLELTFVMLSTLPIAVIAALYFGKYIRSLSKKNQDALADANVVVEETLQSVQIVKAFTNEWFEVNRYNGAIQRAVQLAIRTAKYRGAFVSFLISAVFGGIVLVLWWGALLVDGGEMTMGELLRFVLYTFFIGGAIAGMGDLYGNLQKAIGASERIVDILGETSEVPMENLPVLKPIKGDIIYQNVGFSYPTRKDIIIFDDLSLHIKQGQKIALVGASGAGKSTIVQLLARLYKLEKGVIKIGGKDINNYDISTLRHNIGVVPQEVLLFGGTIAENIAYGKPNASTTEIKAAAKQANALEFIDSFPEGLQTLVGERGVKLSGGQRQRIAIARAILKDPTILILDEATSSLDAESENLVQTALDKLMENRTTIIIAHRLATVREVDCIYVIDKGIIVEQGTHNELSVLEKGIYQHLLKLQFELV